MAMVTKSPLYEDGELAGFITVSSDAAAFNRTDLENLRTNHYQAGANCQPGLQRLNFKKIQWHLRPLIAPVPQIASSVSSLASKLLRQNADDTCSARVISMDTSTDAKADKLEKCNIFERKPSARHHHGESTTVGGASQKDESATEFSRPPKIAARVLAKLQMRGRGKCGKDNGSVQNNGTTDYFASNGEKNEKKSPGGSQAQSSHQHVANREAKGENLNKSTTFAMETAYSNACGHTTSCVFKDSSVVASSGECHECLDSAVAEDPLLRIGSQCDPKNMEPEATNLVIEDEVHKQQERLQFPSSRESIGSHGSSSSKGDNESNTVVECEIQWEDLQLGEEIGQGSYAVVYRGIWNGSDVAVKIYFGNGYTEDILQDYRKEIDIMKRLRHPNVLLFMGQYIHRKGLP